MKRVTLAMAAFAIALPLSAQDQVWTPEFGMQFHNVGSPEISPDGSLVAYTISEALMEGEKSEYLTHIWVAASDGSWNRQFTFGDKSTGNPTFTPDGGAIAFSTSRSGKNQVWLLPIMGGEAQQLTDIEQGVGSWAFSPDGARLAFTARDPDTEEDKARKKEKRDVILVDQDFKYSHLYTVDADPATDDDAQRITEGDFHVTEFDWSPDGSTIAFSHASDPRINSSITRDISTVPSDSGAVTLVVDWEGADRSPRFSPDGRTIAFVSDGGQVERVGLGDVYTVPATGGEVTALAHTYNRSAGLLDWMVDGTAVIVSESRRTYRTLYRLPVDGSEPSLLLPEDVVAGGFSFTPNQTAMAMVMQDPDTPADVYFVDTTTDYEARRLSDANGHLEIPPIGRTELLSWTSPDGLEIEGLLTYPIGYTAGDEVPLVLQVHGGPAGVFSQTYTGGRQLYMTQVFAQRGYAVLRPNPRGSTGYGKEFRYANIMDWGYGDFEDLMSGVDHVLDMGVAHPDSLLLMGWSYGGYMTSFAVTKTDRFQAASMGAGLPNLISMVTTTDIPDYLAAHMGGEFWDDYETYEKHSAMYRIKNVVTPTQVIHGANDLRVPFTQGQEFYVALKRLGVDTEFVVYPRTPHGPREPKLLMDVTPRILTWFEKHMEREGSRPPADTD
ncbi:MAG: S9 family peptidase [Rhodothermales bacterium]|nr:S9 family peptidase [Rhodothermales bacterium]MBO6778532.1 S9 family peptidase [Rhodothermales bacterium]